MSPTSPSILVQYILSLDSLPLPIPFPVPVLSSFTVLSSIHALRVAYEYRKILSENVSKVSWLQGLFSFFVICYGGGTTVSILRGQSPGWLSDNISVINYGFFYWAIFSNDILIMVLDTLPAPLLQAFLILGDAANRAFAISEFAVDGVRFGELGPDKYIAQVILGTLAGCGGGIWADAFKLTTHSWSFSTPEVFRNPNFDMKAAFLTTLFYMFTTTPELYPEAFKEYAPVVSNNDDAKAWSVVLMISMLMGKHAYDIAAAGRNVEETNSSKEKKNN